MIHDILGINISAHKIFQESKFMKNYTGVISYGSKTLTRGGLVNICGVRDKICRVSIFPKVWRRF